LQTKIFLDSGDPKETKQAIDLLGFLDGQTTNPSLIVKHPDAQQRVVSGDKFSRRELEDFYRTTVQEISKFIPEGSVSIEVYADKDSSTEQMLAQAREYYGWIPNAHIKFPCTYEGYKAARAATTDDIRVNMTLCFSQAQAAATHAATKGASRGDVFVSPFIGRLEDNGQNGIDLVRNILRMYQTSESHAQVLTASVRSLEHFIAALELGADIITAPYVIIQRWANAGMPVEDGEIKLQPDYLKAVPYEDLDLNLPIPSYNVTEIHPLTVAGLEKFSNDWNQLIKD